jgi:hypothetical protein
MWGVGKEGYGEKLRRWPGQYQAEAEAIARIKTPSKSLWVLMWQGHSGRRNEGVGE